MWGPARVCGQNHERYFLLVVDDYMRYTKVFPLQSKSDVCVVLILWIRTVRRQLNARFQQDFQLNLWPRVSVPETSPTLRWTGEVGDASTFRGPAISGVSQVDPPPLVEPLEVFSDTSGPAEGGDPAAEDTAATPRSPRLESPPGFSPRPSLPPPQPITVDSGAAGGGHIGGAGFGVPGPWGADSGGAGSGGAGFGGVVSGGAARPSGGGIVGAPVGGYGVAGIGGARVAGTGGAGAGGVGGTGARGAGGTGASGAGGAGAGGVGATGGTGAGAGGSGTVGTANRRPFFFPQPQSSLPPPGSTLRQVLSLPSSTGPTPPLMCPPPDQSQLLLLHGCPLLAPSPYPEQTDSLTERREHESRHASPVHTSYCHALPGHTCHTFESTAASASVTELVEFVATCRLDYFASLITVSESSCPPSIGGELAFGYDVLEDKQSELECLAAAIPHLASMLLCPEGDPDALDIPTPLSYAEAITGEYSSHWQTAMDAEMASWKSTGTYNDALPPPWASIVDGMWIFRVMRPPGSPLAFKACYVARGFSQREGVDFFQTFSPAPKMTTIRVLLHVAAQRDYELQSLDFSTSFL
ncbi:unnamed protein product [Closterium sp. NIES-54]